MSIQNRQSRVSEKILFPKTNEHISGAYSSIIQQSTNNLLHSDIISVLGEYDPNVWLEEYQQKRKLEIPDIHMLQMFLFYFVETCNITAVKVLLNDFPQLHKIPYNCLPGLAGYSWEQPDMNSHIKTIDVKKVLSGLDVVQLNKIDMLEAIFAILLKVFSEMPLMNEEDHSVTSGTCNLLRIVIPYFGITMEEEPKMGIYFDHLFDISELSARNKNTIVFDSFCELLRRGELIDYVPLVDNPEDGLQEDSSWFNAVIYGIIRAQDVEFLSNFLKTHDGTVAIDTISDSVCGEDEKRDEEIFIALMNRYNSQVNEDEENDIRILLLNMTINGATFAIKYIINKFYKHDRDKKEVRELVGPIVRNILSDRYNRKSLKFLYRKGYINSEEALRLAHNAGDVAMEQYINSDITTNNLPVS